MFSAPFRSPTPSALSRATSLPADPWEVAEAESSQDASSNWLLSYSDLMTLLFTFFVMLFAYEKAALSPPPSPAEPPPAASAPAPGRPLVIPALHAAPPPAPAMPTPETRVPVPARPEAPTAEFFPRPIAALTPAAPAAATEPGWQSAHDAPSSEALDLAALGKDIEVTQVQGKLRLEIGASILFDPASAELTRDGVQVLDRLAHWLRGQAGAIAVEGHTDDRPIASGRYRSNWELSAARAGTVARCLIERGVSAERLRAVGLADTQPKVGNLSAEDRAKNRRVALVVFIERGKGLKT
jgi:chemotaxis protein MotB